MGERIVRRAVGVTAAIALLAGAGGAAVWDLKAEAAARAADDACRGVEASVAARGPVRPLSEGPVSVLVVGDSYAAGDRIPDWRQGWAYRLGAAEPGWSVSVDGVGGTGFVSPGPCGDAAFPVRLGRASQYDTVILEGGLNDVSADPARLGAAVDEVLARVRGVRRVVVVGPVAAPDRADGARRVDALLREHTAAAGRQYVSAIGWPVGFGPDGTHMTEAGHAEYTARLVAAVGR